MSDQRLVSPREMVNAAIEIMLDGRQPENVTDWSIIMNFCALNIVEEMRMPSCLILNTIFNMGLTEEEVMLIVAHQSAGTSFN